MLKALPAQLILAILSGGLLLGYLLLGRTRAYLLYLGLAFLLLGISLMLPGYWRWASLLGTLVLTALAIRSAYQDTQQRMGRFRREQQERERAFGEYLEVLAHQDGADTPEQK